MNSLLKLYFFDFLFIIFLLFLYFTSCVYFVSHANFKNICNILLCTSVICQRLLSDRDCIPPLMQICCSPSVKLRITHCLLLFAIEAGDLLDLVKTTGKKIRRQKMQEAIKNRRSIRKYKDMPVSRQQPIYNRCGAYSSDHETGSGGYFCCK